MSRLRTYVSVEQQMSIENVRSSLQCRMRSAECQSGEDVDTGAGHDGSMVGNADPWRLETNTFYVCTLDPESYTNSQGIASERKLFRVGTAAVAALNVGLVVYSDRPGRSPETMEDVVWRPSVQAAEGESLPCLEHAHGRPVMNEQPQLAAPAVNFCLCYPSSKRKVQWRGSLAVCARRVRAQERLKDSSIGPETSSRTPLHALFLVRHVPWLVCTCKPSGSKFNPAQLRAPEEP
ncbi:hypothetical protein KC324_g76 [Hortaea werneckii]|nr:hypothetical protein KC324_g76 [Hortaea werneckii]